MVPVLGTCRLHRQWHPEISNKHHSRGTTQLVYLIAIYNCVSQILTHDSVTVTLNAVVHFRCVDANVWESTSSVKLLISRLAQTTLRGVLGNKSLAQILVDRERIGRRLRVRGDDDEDEKRRVEGAARTIDLRR